MQELYNFAMLVFYAFIVAREDLLSFGSLILCDFHCLAILTFFLLTYVATLISLKLA